MIGGMVDYRISVLKYQLNRSVVKVTDGILNNCKYIQYENETKIRKWKLVQILVENN